MSPRALLVLVIMYINFEVTHAGGDDWPPPTTTKRTTTPPTRPTTTPPTRPTTTPPTRPPTAPPTKPPTAPPTKPPTPAGPKPSTTPAASKPGQECYVVGKETAYQGTASKTLDDVPCTPWKGHTNGWSYADSEKNFVDGVYPSNYCRSPSSLSDPQTWRPWCYVNTTGEDWGYCDVPVCPAATGLPTTPRPVSPSAGPMDGYQQELMCANMVVSCTNDFYMTRQEVMDWYDFRFCVAKIRPGCTKQDTMLWNINNNIRRVEQGNQVSDDSPRPLPSIMVWTLVATAMGVISRC